MSNRTWIFPAAGLIAISLVLTACGGGGSGSATSSGSSSNSDTTPPTVSITSPTNGRTNVHTAAVITATFSEDIVAVTGNSFTLQDAAGSVSGTVTFDAVNKVASFTPAAALLPGRQYTATLGTSITDRAGNALASSYSWHFATLDGNWDTAELIETDDANASSPQVAIGADGNALAVWEQWDGAYLSIWANRYVAGTGWGAAELIETNNTGSAVRPQVAIDDNGNALVVWEQYDISGSSIWANRYAVGTGWGTAELIETNAQTAQIPQVAIDAAGNALAVWQHFDGIRSNIWANRYVVGTGWGTAVLIETNDAGSAGSPQVVFDVSGNALAVWYQSDGTNYSIFANRYVAGTGWSTAELIETNDAGDAVYPQVAIDTAGNALAVWRQSDGTRNNIWANRYVAGTGWGTAELIETNNVGNADSTQVAVDAAGNALAVWRQSDGTRTNIWANRYVVGTGWGMAELIETDDATADSPQLAIDANGNALAMWYENDLTSLTVWANRYLPGIGWGTAELIETADTHAVSPQVAIGVDGNALAVWEQWDGTYTKIWANRFEKL